MDKNHSGVILLSDEQLTEVSGGTMKSSGQTCPLCCGRGYSVSGSAGRTSVSGVCSLCKGTGRISAIAELGTDFSL